MVPSKFFTFTLYWVRGFYWYNWYLLSLWKSSCDRPILGSLPNIQMYCPWIKDVLHPLAMASIMGIRGQLSWGSTISQMLFLNHNMLTESWQTWEGIFFENWEWVKDNNKKQEGTIGVFNIILLGWCCTQLNLHYLTYIVNSLKMS